MTQPEDTAALLARTEELHSGSPRKALIFAIDDLRQALQAATQRRTAGREAVARIIAECQRVIELILPLAKGYARSHRFGANAEYVAMAERLLERLNAPPFPHEWSGGQTSGRQEQPAATSGLSVSTQTGEPAPKDAPHPSPADIRENPDLQKMQTTAPTDIRENPDLQKMQTTAPTYIATLRAAIGSRSHPNWQPCLAALDRIEAALAVRLEEGEVADLIREHVRSIPIKVSGATLSGHVLSEVSIANAARAIVAKQKGK